jgi:hypothetical protein
MAMCCVEAAVGILHPGRPFAVLELATGGKWERTLFIFR